jgi:hypothetical protein
MNANSHRPNNQQLQPLRSRLAKRLGHLLQTVHPKSLRLHRRCRARLRDLELPDRFTIEGLRERLAKQRGRPLYLFALPGPPVGFCGLWIATKRGIDYICYASATPPLQLLHFILHELAHMICGHKPTLSDDDQAMLLLLPALPKLDPATVSGLRARSTLFTREEEREADILAGMIARKARRSRRDLMLEELAADPALRRLEEGFG